ncbi:pickpocket protein 28-like [Thrips palmi]|uniref:Pickpocket protein 28-like n=1 Tax=Thrips palmi TaxID=161013 RepID=A0A6P8ZHT0_THRPL|nr:pickpocket protein 28-like [Thrips palmi]
MTRISVLNTRVPLEEYPFPSVTLCPFHQILKNPALALLRANVNLSSSRAANATPDDAMYLRMMSALQNFRYPQFSADWGKLDVEALESLGSMDAREFLVKVFPPCQIIFKSCRWLNVVVDCCTIFDLQETHNGLCYAFNSCTSRAFKDKECAPRNGSSEKGGGLMVITHFTMPTEVVDTSVVSAFSVRTTPFLRVQRHARGIPSVWSGPVGLLQVVVGNPFEVPQPVGGFFIREDVSISRIEASLSVQLAEPDIAYLPWEARNCMFLDEQPLSIARPYTQQTCIEDCRLQLIWERCGCTPHYFSRSPDQGGVGAYEKSCNATGMQCIFENKSTLRRTNSVPVKNKRELDGLRLLDNDTGYDCTCPSECQILMYRTEITNLGTFKGSPVYDDNDTATTIFVRQRNMEARNIVYLKSLHRTFSEFVADLGNIAALFLGVSILSVFEFGFVSVSCLKTLYEGLKASKI